MIRYLFLAFCIMFSPCLLAQKYEISLAKRKTSKPLQKIAVSKIIDLRYDKTNIGWIQKGLSSDKVPADFKTAIDQEIITFLKNNIAVIRIGMVNDCNYYMLRTKIMERKI